ncbi:MAG: glutamine synthetase III [Chlamydiales bacterium]
MGAVIPSETFGKYVFTRSVMQKMLPQEIFAHLQEAAEGRKKIKPEYADTIAVAIKEWAVNLGATHYTHWFQPLTGASAEKHDAFIEWSTPDRVIEKFNGKQLLQGEPDASSFPSGGLRSTYEARGYTGWDPSSPVFVWKAGDGVTLCIPSIFFSWTGDVLDTKIPLLRSDKKINEAVVKLLELTGMEVKSVFSSLGLEQEYFVIDKGLRDLRPDLLLSGRTVFGARSPKGQGLQDHYFGAVKDRILNYMSHVEKRALELAIPVKTRHNEVAPSQHEVAPVFEKSSIAIDHNILLMELMRKIAIQHDLICLLHEKPFHNLNGSGKHCNWSLLTDTGVNLLDPSSFDDQSIIFIVLLTAILHAIHKHSALLRCSIGSASNDRRLGGHEAPPSIISVYLGDELEAILEQIEKNQLSKGTTKKEKYDFGIPTIPDLSKDNTDRNRTSPFAFTGNKFEFRAVGSSQNPALPVTVLNVIVAESLNEILDEVIATHKISGPIPIENYASTFIPVIQRYLKKSESIRYSGDNYSKEWVEEAKRRKLPFLPKCVEAFEALIDKKTIAAFKGVLSETELQARYEVYLEQYIESVKIEAYLMLDLFYTQILPAALHYQKDISESILSTDKINTKKNLTKFQKKILEDVTNCIETSIEEAERLAKFIEKALKLNSKVKQAHALAFEVMSQCDALRSKVDALELKVNSALWPLPKYHELLFMT